MTAYVILHYRASAYTHKCIQCIKELDGDNHIVVVDNASPDGSGLALKEQYAGDRDVTVVLNSENSGFARGNNTGVRYCKRNLSPDFVVVLNNDVEILQKDFSLRIAEIYEEHPFDLLGPDIVSVFSGIHQSPKMMKGFTLESVRKKMEYVEWSKNPVRILLSNAEKFNPLYWKHVQRRNRAKQHIDSSVPYEGVVIHGSCVIFSRRYIEKHPEPFYCKTFMYYEMEILEWLCRNEGNVIRYDPSISVLHYQYVASKMELGGIMRRSRFVQQCLSDSLKAAEELILMTEQNRREQLAAAEA